MVLLCQSMSGQVDWPQYTNYNDGNGPVTLHLGIKFIQMRIAVSLIVLIPVMILGVQDGIYQSSKPELYLARMEDDAFSICSQKMKSTRLMTLELIQQAIEKNEL